MMTNEEKYPKTEDALAAFRKHKEECKCDCTFDSWLKMPCDDDIEKAIKDMPKGFGMALAGMLAGTLVAGALEKGLADTPKTVADENADIECPLCHGKRGKIDGMIINTFHCPDCGAIISCDKSMTGRAELAEWLAQFNRKHD
jgi:Zn finger protein HypA/HybF involved in hydrogenase expression